MEQKLIQQARKTDLAQFMQTHHPEEIRVSPGCVRLKRKSSLYTKPGYSGYTRFSTGETGNSIDFLTRYMGYSFQEAVAALTRTDMTVGPVMQGKLSVPAPAEADIVEGTFHLPVPDEPPCRRVFAYLLHRGIPKEVIGKLMREGLLYQEKSTGNAVFLSRAKDFCELRGTYSGTVFHSVRRMRPDGFWSMTNTKSRVEKAYICEAAIDAVSLCVLRAMDGEKEQAAFVSIAGVCNQSAIDRISKQVPTILAVDNDAAGEHCRRQNPNLEYLLPVRKDWNEDLLNRVNQTV